MLRLAWYKADSIRGSILTKKTIRRSLLRAQYLENYLSYRLQIWYAALYRECRAGAPIIFLESGRGLGHVTPTIFGSTVGYPSNSLASCSFGATVWCKPHYSRPVLLLLYHNVTDRQTDNQYLLPRLAELSDAR